MKLHNSMYLRWKGLLAAFVGMLSLQSSTAQVEWHREDFAEIPAGWYRATGDWASENDVLKITTSEYDCLLSTTFYLFDTLPFSLEARMRGPRSGLYFSLDDMSSKTLSQMVRFDEKSLLTGYFNGAGEYVATNVFELAAAPADWTILRLDVDPIRKKYTVLVNGIPVGTDTMLVFASGYIGVQASEGTSEFDYFRVLGTQDAVPPPEPTEGSKVGLRHVRYVRTEGRNLTLYNPELRTFQTINLIGRIVRRTSGKSIPTPRQETTIGNRTYRIEGKRILIRDSSGTVIDSVSDRLVSPSELIADNKGVYVADAGAGALLKYSVTGQFVGLFAASSIGGFTAPRGLDLYGDSQLVIADYDKIILVDRALTDIAPSIDKLSPEKVRISWPRVGRTSPRITWAADGDAWQEAAATVSENANSYTFTIAGLRPLARYSFRIAPTLQVIPETNKLSRIYRFTTPSANPNMSSYTRLPVLCMVYRTINFRDTYSRAQYPYIPDGRTISDDEIEYLREATRFNEEFYYRNSSCRIVLDFDFYVVEDTLWLQEVGASDPYWLGPNNRVTRDYELVVEHFGRKPEEYAGLVVPYAWLNYPPRRTSALRDTSKSNSVSIRQAYGGGTNGVPAPWKYGKTAGYTANPFQDRFSRQDWLITHEFHHQIDALMEASGYPEYFHADQPWKMPGRFGEDFDFNAHIIRNAGPDWWLSLKFGQLMHTKDSDRDGVPDEDPSLPFDEKRLNGNPMSVDTDGDGLNDLQEVMAGTSRGTALNSMDTDGDGLPDRTDREPIYTTKPVIVRYPVEDFDLLFGYPYDRGILRSKGTNLFLGWSENALYLGCSPDSACILLVQIDAANDGWFHGFDNLQLKVSLKGDSAHVLEWYLRDCSSWSEPPKDRNDILDRGSLKVERATRGFAIRIPEEPAYGFALDRGKRFGLRFGLQIADDRWVWEELFERNYMMEVELK